MAKAMSTSTGYIALVGTRNWHRQEKSVLMADLTVLPYTVDSSKGNQPGTPAMQQQVCRGSWGGIGYQDMQ